MRVVKVVRIEGKPKNMAERFLWARVHAGLTHRDVAARTGVGYSTICFYETRGTVPSLSAAAALADAYGVRLDWLATGSGPAHREEPTHG